MVVLPPLVEVPPLVVLPPLLVLLLLLELPHSPRSLRAQWQLLPPDEPPLLVELPLVELPLVELPLVDPV